MSGDPFDRHALGYESTWEADPSAIAQRHAVWSALQRLVPSGARVLDVGCGVGTDAAWLSDRGHSVVAVDASAGMVELARERAPGARVVQRAAHSLRGLSSAPFDVALLNFGVLNCVDLERVGAALFQAVRSGGLVVAVPMPRVNPAWMAGALKRLRGRSALRRLKRSVDVPMAGGAVATQYITARQLERAWAPWFELVEQRGLGLVLPPPGSRRAAPRWLRRLDTGIGSLPVVRRGGDHLLMVFRRRVASPRRRSLRAPWFIERRIAAAGAQRDGRIRTLHALLLEVTTGCQSACVGCDHRGAAGGESMTVDVARGLAEDAAAMGCRRAVITGGEPLLRSDLPALMRAVRTSGLAVTLLTNGIALKRHVASVAASCDRVVVSLDGHDASSYLATRGVDGFGAVVSGVAALKALAPGLRVDARVTVSAHNAAHLLAIGQAALSMGCDGVSYLLADAHSADAFRRSGRAGPPLPDPELLARSVAALRQALPPSVLVDSPGAWDRMLQLSRGERSVPKCDAPWTSALVGADLSLRPCFFIPGATDASGGLSLGLVGARAQRRQIGSSRPEACARCVCWARLS